MKRLAVIPARGGATRLKGKNIYPTVRSTALDAMVNLMESEKQEYDIFSYFLPTCPFVTAKDIQKGVSMFDEKEVDFVISMTQIPETIQLACVIKEDWVMPVFDNLEAGLTNSKFIKKYYKPSGGFYMARWDKLLESKNFFKGSVKGVMIPKERSVDIDDIFDIEYAEQILKDTK